MQRLWFCCTGQLCALPLLPAWHNQPTATATASVGARRRQLLLTLQRTAPLVSQAAEVRRAAQELAALRRAATLELQQLQAATGVTIGSCGACRLPSSSGGELPATAAGAASPGPTLTAAQTPMPAPAAAAAAPASQRQPPAVVPPAPPAVPAAAAAAAAAAADDGKVADGSEPDRLQPESDSESEVYYDCASSLSYCSTASRGQAQRRRRRGRARGTHAGRACCSIM